MISFVRSALDLQAHLLRLSMQIGGLLACRVGIREQPVRRRLALRHDVHYRPEKEPGEDPDENQDIDGLERQRPPIDMHELNG